jgi:hypothetical protein
MERDPTVLNFGLNVTLNDYVYELLPHIPKLTFGMLVEPY